MEPTEGNLVFARVGLRVLIRVADWRCFGRDGKWRPIPEGALVLGQRDQGTVIRSAHIHPLDHEQ